MLRVPAVLLTVRAPAPPATTAASAATTTRNLAIRLVSCMCLLPSSRRSGRMWQRNHTSRCFSMASAPHRRPGRAADDEPGLEHLDRAADGRVVEAPEQE